MKIFKRKHFQALIYSIFLALPLLSVLVRCVYTIANKNAKDSYYGETINEVQYDEVTSLSKYHSYHYKSANYSPLFTDNSNEFIMVSDIENVYSSVTSIQTILENSSYATYIYFVNNGSVNPYLRFTDEHLNVINNVAIQTSVIEFDFYLLDYNNIQSDVLSFMSIITYNEYSYLDNAFEYSIDRFVSENDYGYFDFFQWFSTFFLSNTSINNLYIHFVNWYLNYVLYVSLGYLIFSVLFWFVNFFRRLVEDTQNINVGGM